ncbi:DJ-1 family protein [Pseudoprevotella muciniphila]|uniref:DJ-1 family protein n=1 Tax=Pseudoprevotella muciniphila TaxID=2133944 RepID=A0A5P8E4E6_9BACT|nr:DJ-1 family glyoxalase III [Pseudoprevotella muciniphila]QFQ11885.1 DJ-1 family protein [Pseudoprevotella muciniphila]
MIHLFLAEGFEEIEALGTLDILRRCGLNVQTVSINKESVVSGAHGIDINADITWDELDLTNVENIILPGGMPGAENLRNKAELISQIKLVNTRGGIIGAICAAPFILGTNKMLTDKRATCYPGFEKYLEGATTTGNLAEEDGNIITGKGPGATFEFAAKIAKRFVDSKIVDDVLNGMIAKSE